MKAKFVDLTISQAIKICKENYHGTCNGCPLYDKHYGCMVFATPYLMALWGLCEREIELPDKETNDEG